MFPNQQGSAYLLVQGNAESATFARLYKMPSGAYAYDTMIIDAEGKESGGNIEEIKAPSPHKLTFTGAAAGEYDGSEAVSIEIPEGGGSGSGSGLPESTRSNQMLVTDENNDVTWAPRTHYTEKSITNLLYQETLEGGSNYYQLKSAMDYEPVDGQTYTLIWGGQTYSSPCADVTALFEGEGPSKAFAFGDLAIVGDIPSESGITNPKPGAPYAFLYIPEGDGEAYGMMISMEDPTPPTLSVIGIVEVAVPLDEKYLPENVRNNGRQITLTIDADNNVTSDTDFETAWGMTDAQLQAAITIKWQSNSSIVPLYHPYHSCSAKSVIRAYGMTDGVVDTTVRMIQIAYQQFEDIGDIPYSTIKTKYIRWVDYSPSTGMTGWLRLEKGTEYSIPFAGGNREPEEGYIQYTAEGNPIFRTVAETKEKLGIPTLPAYTAADAGKVLGIGAEGNLDWKSGGAYVINLSAITVDTSASPLQPSSTPTVEQGSCAGALEAIANGQCVLCYMPADMGGMLMTYCCPLQGYVDGMGVIFHVHGLDWSIFIMPDNSVEIDT